MPTKLDRDSFTIKEILQLQYQDRGGFKNRFKYMRRDVLKSIEIREVKTYTKDRKLMVGNKFIIRTSSYPQYKPYIKLKGKKSKTQRRIKHQYDTVIQLERLSINVPFRVYVGSHKKWESKPSQNQIKSIYRGSKLSNEKKERLRKNAKYISVGDFNAKKLGINGDWRFRAEWVFKLYGMCFGNAMALTPPKITNPHWIPFFPKHLLRIIIFLMEKGILKDD